MTQVLNLQVIPFFLKELFTSNTNKDRFILPYLMVKKRPISHRLKASFGKINLELV